MELRWVLLGLGLLVILGITLFGLGVLRRPAASIAREKKRTEPSLEPTSEVTPKPESATEPPRGKFTGTVIERAPSPRRVPEKVVALRLVPRDELPSGETTVLALR